MAIKTDVHVDNTVTTVKWNKVLQYILVHKPRIFRQILILKPYRLAYVQLRLKDPYTTHTLLMWSTKLWKEAIITEVALLSSMP